jgi:hypothetical protein
MVNDNQNKHDPQSANDVHMQVRFLLVILVACYFIEIRN